VPCHPGVSWRVLQGEIHGFNGKGFRAGEIDVQEDALKAKTALGHLKSVRGLKKEAWKNAFFLHSDHTVMRPGHPGITEKSGPSLKDTGIGGLNMGMSADDSTHTTIKIAGQGDLFTTGLCVNIDKDGAFQLGENLVSKPKGARKCLHKYPTLKIQNVKELAVS
jgi:hypothetical protein